MKRTNRHLIGILLCTAAVIMFQHVMLLWMIADYDPTGALVISPEVKKKKEIGRAFALPMMAPTLWIASKTGAEVSGLNPTSWVLSQSRGYYTALLMMQWLFFPLCYGTLIYMPFGLLVQLRRSRMHIDQERAEPDATANGPAGPWLI